MQANQPRNRTPQNSQHVALMSVVGEDDDIHPQQLSGDQNDLKNIHMRSGYTNQYNHKANFSLTSATIIKSIIGSGIISMPYTVSKTGWVFGLILYVLAALLNHFGSVLLLKAKNLSRHSNYSTILYEIWNNKISRIIGSLTIFLNNAGICIVLMIIFKQALSQIICCQQDASSCYYTQPTCDWYTNQIFLVSAMAASAIPFAFVKKIEKLKLVAFFGVIGIFVFAISFVIFFFQGQQSDHSIQLFPSDPLAAIAAIPNIILTFGFQMNLFPIFKGMQKANDRNMRTAVAVSIVLCTIIYMAIGVLGYLYFGNSLQVNFLLSFTHRDTLYYFINCSFLFSVCCAFPILFFGCRNNFIAISQLIRSDKDQSVSSSRLEEEPIPHVGSEATGEDQQSERRKIKFQFRLFTLIIFLIIVGAAMAICDAGIVFNITGAASAFPISILFPCLFYFKLIQKKKLPKTIKYYIALFLFTIGVPLAVGTIVAQVIIQVRRKTANTASFYVYSNESNSTCPGLKYY